MVFFSITELLEFVILLKKLIIILSFVLFRTFVIHLFSESAKLLIFLFRYITDGFQQLLRGSISMQMEYDNVCNAMDIVGFLEQVCVKIFIKSVLCL